MYRPGDSQAAPNQATITSWLKSAEEEATLLTIDLSAPFLPLEKYIFGKYCCQILISRIWEHPPPHAIWATLSLLKSAKVDLGRGAHPNARKFGSFFTLKEGVKNQNQFGQGWGGGPAQFGQYPKEKLFLFKDCFP